MNKEKRKTDLISDNIVNIKTKNKLDLITKNMERDSRNLNNPNEFYADLFNTFYKQKIRKYKSRKTAMPKIKIGQSTIEKKTRKESREEDKENSLNHS